MTAKGEEMMKKFKMIKLLSLLLCAVMLLASCSDGSENPSTDENGGAASLPPEAEKVDVSTVISGVDSYLGYIGNHNNSSLNVNSSLYDETAHETLYRSLGDFAVIRKRIISENFETGLPEYVSDTYSLKSFLDGKTLWTSNAVSYFYGTEPLVKYDFTLLGGAVLEIHISEAIISISPEGTSFIDGYKETYTYKDVKGIFEDTLTFNRGYIDSFGNDGDLLFILNSKSYLIRDGEIIYQFVAGTEREIPSAYHEFKGYKYVINNMNSELYVQILDANYVCISEFQLPAKVVSKIDASSDEAVIDNSVYILGNGNLLIQGLYSVADGEEFDYFYEDDTGRWKCFTYTALFNIETGEVTEINPGYIIKDFYSFESEDAPCLLSNEHNVAEIAVFDKLNLTESKSLVVLDNKGTVVATLPTALPNQDTDIESIRFIDDSRFIFTTTVNDSGFVYHVDIKAQKMTLVDNDAVYMDGYFYTDRAIYSNSLEALHRFTDKEEIIAKIGNGLVIRSGNEYKIFSVGAFGIANFVTVADVNKGEVIRSTEEDCVVVSKEGATLFQVYNAKGEVILSSDSVPEISELGDGTYVAVITDEIMDEINLIAKTYKKAYVLMCK